MATKEIIILIIVLISIFSVGVYAILSAKNGWYNNHKSKKISGKIIRSILGEKAFGYFIGLIGGIFILISLSLTYMIFIHPNMPGRDMSKRRVKKSEQIIVEKHQIANNTTVTVMVTMEILNFKIKYAGTEEFETYRTISFENNYLKTIPKIVWKMKQLEEINLTNNDITQLPIENLNQLQKLKKIIIKNNPISKEYFEKLKKEVDFEIIFEVPITEE